MLRSQRGAGLVEIVLGIFVLALAGLVFSASFPSGFSSLRQASENTNASIIAQRKMEQIRGLDYASLNYANLAGAGILDTSMSPSGDYTFTAVDGVSATLPSGVGVMTITTESGGVKRVEVSVNWIGGTGIARNLTVTTLVADTSPWVN